MKHYMRNVVRTLSPLAVAAVMGVALIFACVDTSMLTKLRFVGKVPPREAQAGKLYSEDLDATIGFAAEGVAPLGTEGTMPDLSGAIAWINSAPLSKKSLRGKVVLVDIWTYSCINSLRQLPYLKAWAAKYKDQGLVVIGVHTPEFEFEKDRGNVANALRELNITYPIAIDSNRAVWDAFNNQYWPADYIVDAKGQIRYHHFGEGDYDVCERVIQELLKENGATGLGADPVSISATGVEAPPSRDLQSPETYLGYRRAERFQSPERVAHDSPMVYTEPAELSLNQWGLGGAWDVGPESVVLQASNGKIEFRFHAATFTWC